MFTVRYVVSSTHDLGRSRNNTHYNSNSMTHHLGPRKLLGAEPIDDVIYNYEMNINFKTLLYVD